MFDDQHLLCIRLVLTNLLKNIFFRGTVHRITNLSFLLLQPYIKFKLDHGMHRRGVGKQGPRTNETV